MKQFHASNAIFQVELSKQAKLVYLYLCRCADADGCSFPSKKNIAWACSISETSVDKAIHTLHKLELIAIYARKRANGSQTSNQYRLAVVEKKWFQAPDALFEKRISSTAKLMYLYLCRMAGKHSNSYPARKLIAQMCSCGLSSIRSARLELEKGGFIDKDVRYRENNGGQSSNLYTLKELPVSPAPIKLRVIEGGKQTEKIKPIIFDKNIYSIAERKRASNSKTEVEKQKATSLPRKASMIAKRLHIYTLLGASHICAPPEGTPNLRQLNRKKNNSSVQSNLVQISRPP